MVTDTGRLPYLLTPGMEDAAVVNEELPSEPASVSIARRQVAQAFTSWGFPPAIVDDAKLIVTEIVTNAVQHTGSTRLRLYCWRGAHLARLGVHDFSRELPVRMHTRGESLGGESGRGLGLINTLSHRWGVDSAIVGKVVWAELRAPRPRNT